MTKSEAIHRAALRKHRHKGNYISTHEALLAEAEYLQQLLDDAKCDGSAGPGFIYLCKREIENLRRQKRRSLWQIIKGWFA